MYINMTHWRYLHKNILHIQILHLDIIYFYPLVKEEFKMDLVMFNILIDR